MMIINYITAVLLLLGITHVAAQTDPSNIVCTAVNSTTLGLTWDQATAASVLGYFLHIERVDGVKIEPAIPSVDLNSKTYDNYYFYGLGKYGMYNITIHSYTSSTNLTNYVTTCTTSEDVPDGAPSTFYCTGISVSSISCTWSALDLVYWNGVPVGYRLQWLSSNVSALYQTTEDSNTTTKLVTGLYYGTTYMFMLNPYTSTGDGTLYATTTAATKGVAEPVVENVTRYYCNEAVPGMLEFGWEEMPCTIYTGTISALFVICGLFIGIIACMSCCGKSSTSEISMNFFESSNGRNDHDDDDDTDTDDDNDRKSSDDYDDDGYENKGYRSEEDKSPDGRRTETPEEDMKSPDGTSDTPASRQSLGENAQTKVEYTRQLTARDVELEEISEDGEEMSDSDYDTQSECDDIDVGNNISGAGAAVLSVNTTKQVKSKVKETPKRNKNGGTISVDVSTKRNVNKDSMKKSNAKTATTVALIHTEATARGTSTIPNGSSNETEHRNTSSANYNDMNDVNDEELDPWDSPSLKTRQTAVNPPSVSENTEKNLKIAPVEDEWGDEIAEESYTSNNSRNVDNNSKNPSSKHLQMNKGQKSTNEFELLPLGSSSSKSNKSIYNPMNMQNSGIKSTNEDRKRALSSPVNDWDEGDGWGGVFIDQNRENTEAVPDGATGNDGKRNQTNLSVFQTSYNSTGKFSDWDDEFQSEESTNFIGIKKTVAKSNDSVANRKAVVETNQRNKSASNKMIKNAHNSANIIPDTGKPKLTQNNKKDNQAQGQVKSNEFTIPEEYSNNQKHDKVRQNAKQTASAFKNAKGKEKISFRDQQNEALKSESPNLKTNTAEHKNRFFIEDELDNVNLTTEKVQRPTSGQNGRMVATKAWLPQSNDGTTKPGRKTPVKVLPKVQSWTTVEIEPVTETDRLGKKFPFLNVDSNSMSESDPRRVTSGNRLRKNVSDSDLVQQPNIRQNARDVPAIKRISEGDVLSKFMNTKPEPTNQTFYGFGAGRFRNMAAVWVAKFRSKKSPVQTVQSDWR